MHSTYTVPPDVSDRLDRILPCLAADLSRAAARRLIAAGAVFLNGRRCRVASRTVRPGDRLRIETSVPDTTPGAELAILHLDDALVAVDKPPGMPSAPTRAASAGTALELLRAELRRRSGPPSGLWSVHRLDADTSGVLLFARTRAAAAALSAAFRRREVVKIYRARVVGRLPATNGSIEQPLVARAGRAAVDPRGRPARTDWRSIGEREDHSVVEVTPHTGRMHQIRVHLAALGCPIVGDRLYGGPRAARLMLHAVALDLPWQGGRLRIESPLPDGFGAG
jgi:23S rRNA pseudouridine1911/1915/1917 synthase